MQSHVRRVPVPALVLAFFVALAGVGVGAGGVASALRKPPTAVIATVKLKEVYDNLDKRKEKEKEFDAKEAEFRSKLEALMTRITEEAKIFETMPEGPEKKQRGQEIIRNKFQYDNDLEYANKFLDQMKGEMLRELFDEIVAACRELSLKAGYTLVITDDTGAPVRGIGSKEINNTIAVKRILYVDPAHDITRELIDYMNNQFAAAGRR